MKSKKQEGKDRRRLHSRKEKVQVRYGELPAENLKFLIEMVVHSGGAILFGRTSDGGALAITVFIDDDRIKEYFDHTALVAGEFEELLDQWISDLEYVEEVRG